MTAITDIQRSLNAIRAIERESSVDVKLAALALITATSADALMTCASKLSWYSRELGKSTQAHHRHWAEVFERLRMQCVNTVELQAQHNWQSRSKGSAVQ